MFVRSCETSKTKILVGLLCSKQRGWVFTLMDITESVENHLSLASRMLDTDGARAEGSEWN